MNLKYMKVDNKLQYFQKNAFDSDFLVLLDECLGEIFKSVCELFQALIALTTIEFWQ